MSLWLFPGLQLTEEADEALWGVYQILIITGTRWVWERKRQILVCSLLIVFRAGENGGELLAAQEGLKPWLDNMLSLAAVSA